MRTIEFEIPKGFKIDKKKTTNDKIILKSVEDQFVDLGLPSGTLWANETEEGYYTQDEAVEEFQDSLPTIVDFAELVQYCKLNLQEEGILITGPNGNSITLSRLGFCSNFNMEFYDVGVNSYYWSASPHPSNKDYAYGFECYSSGNVYPASNSLRSNSYLVCCIKRK